VFLVTPPTGGLLLMLMLVMLMLMLIMLMLMDDDAELTQTRQGSCRTDGASPPALAGLCQSEFRAHTVSDRCRVRMCLNGV
jgi:hypothetical protein